MNKITFLQKCIFLLVGFIGIFVSVLMIKDNQNLKEAFKDSNNSLIISHESGFYSDDVMLEITGNNIKEIYYTLDGSEPSGKAGASLLYSDGIFMLCEEKETPYTVRILVNFQDGTSSDIINRSFITGKNIKERYDVSVLSLTASEGLFFDENYGIIDSEYRFYDGADSEKEIYLTLFDAKGNVQLSQNCGIRINGNFSRNKNQPSFRLYARSEYDEIQNDFEYAFFPNQYTEKNTIVPEYKRVVVRNSGNDNGFAFIRNELASRLSLDAGFPDAACASPVAVYLNDTYYGFYWIVTNFDESYYRSSYGDYEGNMYTLIGAIEDLPDFRNKEDEVTVSLLEEYEEKIDYFASCNLNLEKNWLELNSFMDVENFLQYAAINNYVCNLDSFQNNVKVYRYVAPKGGSYTENTVFDGRYRFILYDLDYAFGYTENGEVKSSVEHLTTTERMNSTKQNYQFFINLMKRPDCQEYYIRYMLSLQNYYFSSEYAGAVLNEMHESREQELYYTYTTTDLLVDNFMAPDITSGTDIAMELDKISNFLANRYHYITQDLSGCFGPFTTYNLSLYNPDEASIALDYAIVNENYFEGLYYKEVPLTVTVQPKLGYQFDYWLINDKKYHEASIEITSEMLMDESISIECHCIPDSQAQIAITAIKSNTGNDYIELTNFNVEAISLKRYYLTDDDKWNKCSLPAIRLEGGESVTIYCNNYTGFEALGKPYVNFNLKEGETLSLYRRDRQLLQAITVPELGTEEGVYRMDVDTGIFREES